MYEEEKVIDIKDMLYRTCRHWRSIFAAGLIGFVCSLLIKIPLLIQFVETSQNNALIETIGRYGGLGLGLGIILAFFLHMLSYALSDKIYLPEDLGQKYGIHLIGAIPKSRGKKKRFLDYWVKRVFGIKISEELQENLAERAAEEISVLAAIRGKEWPDVPVIALVSSYSPEISAGLEQQLAKKLKKDVRLVNAGNILQDARSIRMVERADFVVLVEKQGVSSFKEYREACGKLSLWEKDVLGVVLIDVV